MPADNTRRSLVTVLNILTYGQVTLERFEVEQAFAPLCVDLSKTYSVETHREGFSVRDLQRSGYVDIATWLHRSGLWDQLPKET